eukprot:759438-Hanusia_phi.AAC.2
MQHRRHSCPDVLLIHSTVSWAKHTRDDTKVAVSSHRKETFSAFVEVINQSWNEFRRSGSKHAGRKAISQMKCTRDLPQETEVLFTRRTTVNQSAIDVNGNFAMDGSHGPINLHTRDPFRPSIDEGGNYVQQPDSQFRYKEFTFGHL